MKKSVIEKRVVFFTLKIYIRNQRIQELILIRNHTTRILINNKIVLVVFIQHFKQAKTATVNIPTYVFANALCK